MVAPTAEITSRIQKGGALLGDMRQLVCHWGEKPEDLPARRFVRDILPKATQARANDTYIRSFRPRFINGSPANAWELCAALEECLPSTEIARVFYYWITARAEPILYHYVTHEVFEQVRAGITTLTSSEASAWVRRVSVERGKDWSDIVILQVARSILAALRDFGILSGSSKKTVIPAHLPLESFCLIAFCLRMVLNDCRELSEHPDWRLFLLSHQGVERLLLEAHQQGWLDYQAAGRVSRLEFPSETFNAYVRRVLDR